MCTIPPAPPPPPPPPLSTSSSSSAKLCDKSPTFQCTSDTSDVCQWASFEPQLWEVCVKNNICLNEAPYQYTFKNFEPIIQNGPTCGLVALSMMLNGEVTSDEMLNITRIEGFSNNGEMFSCINMAKLADKVFSLAEIENVICCVKNGGLFSEDVIFELLSGAVLLVAYPFYSYDADFNHAPCQRKGHTAHWALVCGIIIVSDPGNNCTSDPNNVYVLCRHGKSKHLCVWTLDSLDKSNKNLMEFSPKKKEDGLLYVLPEDGIGGENGLRDTFLLFKGL